ncbi:elongator complex protein 3 [Anaerotardibacter muris]|uniref:elongator complex protein 3 n=1 Tax=Anaerotardibacter muris TaxID=2941505 RepID=UPI00203DA787|nr:elongator complex protein 3 [Anaerotardibacter muris]
METIIAEIVERLRSGEELSAKDLLRILNDHNRELQSNARHYSKKKLLPFYLRTKERAPEIWAAWNITPELEQQLIALLQVKPRRSASGVATITVITKPWKCSGACIYCPNDVRMPKSYLADEPACQRAERNYFDPYLQVTSRLRALNQMGHVTDKIELIVLGGTWSDYPREYQVWFITELFRALNDADSGAPSADGQPQSLADVNARERRHWYKKCGLTYDRDGLIAATEDVQRRVDDGELTYNDAIAELYEGNDAWCTITAAQRATMEDLEREQAANEQAKHRVVGLVVETRPTTINTEGLTHLRRLGATKLQMGIQSLDPRIHELNKRPSTREDLARALDLTRLFGFKTHTHFMVNLLGATPDTDREDFRAFVSETAFQPDEIKLYPCALVKGTELCAHYEDGTWQPYDEETLVNVLVDDVLATPGFTRISRMIRDFSAHDIMAGNKKVNLRQLVEARAEERVQDASSKACEIEESITGGIQEIRHREISTQDVEVGELRLETIPYETISTHEFFLQWVTPENKIAGFLRLSLPKPEAFEAYDNLPVSADEAMIREVHVYGRVSSLHQSGSSAQHRGLGKSLIERACEIARSHGYKKLNVISSVGTRAYYRAQGFTDGALYQQRTL